MITVPFPGGIAGEVRAKATGAAVARGRLDGVGPGGATATTTIRKDGTFRLLRLTPGRWRVTTVAAGFRNAEQELDVPASAALRRSVYPRAARRARRTRLEETSAPPAMSSGREATCVEPTLMTRAAATSASTIAVSAPPAVVQPQPSLGVSSAHTGASAFGG